MSETKRDWYQIFLSAISLALAVLVVLLVLENRNLKQKLSGGGEPRGGLAVGEIVSPFSLADASGAAQQVSVGDGHPRLLLVFTSTCPNCTHAIPIWRDLLRENGGGMEVLGVQMDAGTAAAKPIETLPFPVYSPGSAPPEFLSKVPWVPCTIVVDGAGKVETLFYGPPDGKNAADLRSALLKARG